MRNRCDAFNLLDAPWLPVLFTDGTCRRLGIIETLTSAHRIRDIATSSPLDRVSILRFLLALLYWSRGGPPALQPGTLESRWFDKLREHEDRFALLGDETRFYQTRTSRLRPVTDLIHEIPTANNFAHFMHVVDGQVGLCLACCAMGLLRLPLFAVSGTGGVLAGINGVPPFYVLVEGPSLLATLHLNWKPCEDLGNPSWEKPLYGCQTGERVPLLEGLTALARRVWLGAPVENDMVCVRCGTNELPVLAECGFEGADRYAAGGWIDPHVLYSRDKGKAIRPPNPLPSGKFVSSRPWTSLDQCLVEAGSSTSGVRANTAIRVYAFACNQALAVDAFERVVVPPSDPMSMDASMGFLNTWKDAASRLLPASACRSKKLRQAIVMDVLRHVDHVVSDRVGRNGGRDGLLEWANQAFAPLLNAVARSAVSGATVDATRRRATIANAQPLRRSTNANRADPATEEDHEHSC